MDVRQGATSAAGGGRPEGEAPSSLGGAPPSVLESLERDGGSEGGDSALLRQALCELHAIHRAEQALLLSHAAELGLAGLQLNATRFPLLGPALGARSEDDWRRAARAERGFAEADGAPLAPLLRVLGDDPCGNGLLGSLDGIAYLASASVALEPWPESRLTLARVHLARGREVEATRELAKLERTPGIDWSSPLSRVLRTAIVGLRAACAEWRGEPRLALDGFLEQLARDRRFHPAAMTLALALSLGDCSALEVGTHSLAVLHMGARSGSSPDWAQTAACLRSHVRAVGGRAHGRSHRSHGAATWGAGPARERMLFDLLCHADPWSVRVALLTLGRD